jgi:hypothetical protein
MPVDLSQIKHGKVYSRHELAKLWGYRSFHAIARGVVTPTGDNKIVLFITKGKQDSAEPYADDWKSGQRVKRSFNSVSPFFDIYPVSMSAFSITHSLRTDLRFALGSYLRLVAGYKAVSNSAQGGLRKNTIALL